MLVLSRRVGEKVLLGDGVVITVLGFRGSQVRLGIEAPSHVSIWREEVRGATKGKDAGEFPAGGHALAHPGREFR